MTYALTYQTGRHISSLFCLRYLIDRSGRGYCTPSQVTIKTLLKRYYGVKIEISQLNVWLRYLQDTNLIHRIRRVKRGPHGHLIAQTTLYQIKRAGWRLLKKLRLGGRQFVRVMGFDRRCAGGQYASSGSSGGSGGDSVPLDEATIKRRLAELKKKLE
jgi:hypothetical protein